jgi:hypothetical protein
MMQAKREFPASTSSRKLDLRVKPQQAPQACAQDDAGTKARVVVVTSF